MLWNLNQVCHWKFGTRMYFISCSWNKFHFKSFWQDPVSEFLKVFYFLEYLINLNIALLCAFSIPLWCMNTIRVLDTCRIWYNNSSHLKKYRIWYVQIRSRYIFMHIYNSQKSLLNISPNVYTKSGNESCFYQHCLFFNKVALKYQILKMISWNKSQILNPKP